MEVKKHFTVSISEAILNKFCGTASRKSINKSLLIENFLKEWLSKNELSDNDELICNQHCNSYNSNVASAN